MNRILLLLFLLPGLPAFSQHFSEKLTGKWSFSSRAFVGEGTEADLTWNQRLPYERFVLEFRGDSTAQYGAEKAFDYYPFAIQDSLLTVEGQNIVWNYRIEKLTEDSLVLLQVDVLVPDTKNPGTNTIFNRQTYLRKPLGTALINVDDTTGPFTVVEEMPEFPGGQAKLMKFLGNTIRYPKAAFRNKISGVVLVNFIIDANGKAVDVEILRSPGMELAIEVIRIMKYMPQWNPGKQDGKPVPVRYTLPVAFRL